MVDLGEIMRREGARYLETHFVTRNQRKAIYAIAGCRTETMDSVPLRCEECEEDYRLYRSCGNRSCPLCQGEARGKWLEARLEEILPVPYLQVVFKVPPELNRLALYSPETIYEAVMRAAGQAVIDVGRSELHVQLGCLVQHQTWTQLMAQHLHGHCVVPCGGFSEDGSEWISFEPDQLPVKALSRRFKTLLCQSIRAAAQEGKLEPWPDTVSLDQVLRAVMACKRMVYAKPPFGGAEQLLAYLGQYMYRVAITNERIEWYENHQVTFQWRDYRDGKIKSCTLEAMEFVRRFLMHVPPSGFVRVRSYGFLGNRNRKKNLERARELIGTAAVPRSHKPFRAVRLCPACQERRRNERTHHVVRPDVRPQFDLPLRPPPIGHLAA